MDFETETLVLDNASQRRLGGRRAPHDVTTEVIALDRRRGRGENATELLRRARGRFCLMLNEDSELEPGATAALHAALAGADAAAAGATLVSPDGVQQPSAWRFPSAWTAPAVARRAGAAVRGPEPRPRVRTSTGRRRRRCWCAARRPAVDWLDGDEVGFCRRLRAAGRRVLYVPEARAVHHQRR